MRTVQISFSRLFGQKKFATDAEAKAARDLAYRMFIKEGIKARRSVLKDQWNKYSGFGMYNPQSSASVCDVYYLTVTCDEANYDRFADLFYQFQY
jgi:hypothetical protein